jgi:phage/plasmid-like protein (TIGR03299 family)
MAHNLEIKDGKASFVTTKPAWHKLGTVVENAMTSEEAIKLAGLDYEVAKVPVLMEGINGFNSVVPDHFITKRTDTNETFGIVGNKYEVVQNKDAFNFFDAIVGGDLAMFETAGALGKGEKIFITAKMPDFIRITGTDDLTECYVILTSSHDGSGAVIAGISPIRIVCENTMRLSLKKAISKVSIRHTTNVKANLDTAHKLIGISHAYITELNECFNVLAKKKISDNQVLKLVEQLFVSEKEDSTRIKNIREAVLTSYHTGIGQEGILGTAWGFLNGLTHFHSHIKEYKNADVKFENLLMDGASSKVNDKALDLLLAL